MATHKRRRASRERQAAIELLGLVGRVIEALQFYDSDDGHNDLVRAGIEAEHQRISKEYEWELFDRPSRQEQRRGTD